MARGVTYDKIAIENGRPVDAMTGLPITETDPRWPHAQAMLREFAAVNAQNADVASHGGQHATFDPSDTGDPNNYGLRTPQMVDNPSMFDDPEFWLILAGMGGVGAAAAAGAGGGGAAAGAGYSGFVGPTLPAASSAVAPTAAGTAAATGGAGAAAASSLVPGMSNAALFQTGAGLFGNIFGAWMASSGADKAAQQSAQAAEYAAKLQYDANQQALRFSRESAENAYLNSEAARKGNYDIWSAGQRRLGFLGSEVGLPDREIPAYVPGVDPRFTDGGAPGAPGAPASSGGAGPNDPLLNLAKQATAKGLRGQAAVDWINQQQPGAAVVVKAGSASPAGKLVWYDKGALPNGTPSGKFQVAGQWEYSDDPNSWQNGAPTAYRYVPLTGGGGSSAPASPGMFAPYTSGPPMPFYRATAPAPIPGYLGGY